MSRLICSAALLLAAACGPARQVDVCARDPGVASLVAGGALQLTVRDAVGRPLAVDRVAADAPSSASLGSGGAVVDVEALGNAGELVAAGRSAVGVHETCVCLRRVVWRGFATWQDSAGTYHDGPSVELFVGADAGPRIVQATPVQLDRAVVGAGETLTASVTWTNRAGVALGARELSIVATPPGATHAAGVVTLTSQAVTTAAAGDSVTLTGTRTFDASDAVGAWHVFGRFVDALGALHDGPAVDLTVGAAPGDAIVPVAPVRFDKASIAVGDTVVAHALYRNDSPAAAAVQRLVITTRRPGATNAGGPFDDFSPVAGAQSLAPGATLDVMATRDFAAADDPCAAVECVVSDGQCHYTVNGVASP